MGRSSKDVRAAAYSCALVGLVSLFVSCGGNGGAAEVAPTDAAQSAGVSAALRVPPENVEAQRIGALAMPTPSAESARTVHVPRPLSTRVEEASSSTFASEAASPSSGSSIAAPAASYFPIWASTPALNTISFDYDSAVSSTQNGANLKARIATLKPGDRLEIGPGTYSINSYFGVDLQGTLVAPIWIVAKAGATPVITRPNASQNAMNVGVSKATRFVCIRGLEITGGSAGIRLYAVQDFWLDRCHVHHTNEAGVTANTADTARLYLTRNQVDHTLGTGEGFYLGANNAQFVMRDSVVALNHVHDTAGTQGDGIEIKQGSFGNWVAQNLVHDTKYPCILLYGTGGNPFNVVERNICWNAGDNVMQVQGEALVRNNLLMNGTNGFGSHDHQGQVRDLTFVHNTIVNPTKGAQLSNWSGRPGMVFANNVVYSETSQSIAFSGSSGVTITGNVVVGPVTGASSGWKVGGGLSDFKSVTWDASQKDASLSATSKILGSGDPLWEVADDITGKPRIGRVEAGCYDGP
jgi:hypothetical protein